MTKETAFRELDERKKKFSSMIPAGASRMRTGYLRNVVEEQVGAAQKHLQALYASNLEVGPGFTPLKQYEAHPKYAFWLDGIQRHLKLCEAALAEQPAGA